MAQTSSETRASPVDSTSQASAMERSGRMWHYDSLLMSAVAFRARYLNPFHVVMTRKDRAPGPRLS